MAEFWKANVKDRLQAMGVTPTLTICSVGDPDPASEIYIRNKINACHACGIKVRGVTLGDMPAYRVMMEIKELSENSEAFILQLPINSPEIDAQEAAYAIAPESDVDCMSYENIGQLHAGTPVFIPATVKGIMKILQNEHVEIEGKNAVVVGRSNIVGRPMAAILEQAGATVTVCHSKTKHLSDYTTKADILISSTGVPGIIKPSMMKYNATVIDVGIYRGEDGKICGDVCSFDKIKEVWGRAGAGPDLSITPVPGGVGLMTVAALMDNVLQAAEMRM